ncbi:TPA: zeta toxin family protein [Streptococcus suis]
MQQLAQSLLVQGFPALQEPMPRGDMPGDAIFYSVEAFNKAQDLYRQLIDHLPTQATSKFVLSIAGGSGSGKTTLASILAYYFQAAGIGTYILSGDNYPHRIPQYNDGERLQTYRDAGQAALVAADRYDDQVKQVLEDLYAQFQDGSQLESSDYPWYQTYHQAGKRALANYLGTEKELNFPAINRVLTAFKEGQETIWLKRMGRTPDDLWYDPVNFKDIQLLIVEWTHGNHADLGPVDCRLFLNSTPQETLAYRQLRARDGQADSAFVTMVLEIEQAKLHQQAKGADLIFSKQGEVLSYQDYLSLTKGEDFYDL